MNPEMEGERVKRERNQRGHGERLRIEILETASVLLNELGAADGLSLRAVAKRLGIAAPSAYAHFSGKAELVDALVGYERGRIGDHMDAAAESAGGNPRDRLRASVHALAMFLLRNPGAHRVLLQAQRATDEVPRENNPTLERITVLLRSCVDAGLTVRLPVARAAVLLAVGAPSAAQMALPRHSSAEAEAAVCEFVDDLVFLVLGH
ncbi:TetR/AcrR family transcriptional regulator [Amycolatopsis sp. NPDC059027]|uniref:TetR/AcrR family transcriptional regulator n=1 Tax=unclassified Amycolatopsis TaxID=2618356 RepID=UPI00366D25E3